MRVEPYVQEKAVCVDRRGKKYINSERDRGIIQMAEIKSEIINILRRYLDDVERICHVDKAFIFGSIGQNKFTLPYQQ